MKPRHKVVPACYLVLIKDNHLLMLRRYNTGYNDGKYALIAGHLDGQETFREAMVREANEESGIKLNPADLKVVHFMHRFEKSNPQNLRERVDIFLQAEKWEGEPKNMEPDKCDDMQWFPLDNTPTNTIPFIKQFIESLSNSRAYSEFGFEH